MASTIYLKKALVRRPPVLVLTGMSTSTLYERISGGLFTKPVRLGPRAVGWPLGEIEALNAARIAGKSDIEIKELVAALHAARLQESAE